MWWGRGRRWAGPYQLEADLPVLPVHLGVVVPQAGGRAAGSAGRGGRGRVPQQLQGVRQALPEAAAAAGMAPEGVKGVVFVQVGERLLRDAVQLLQLPFDLRVPGGAMGKGRLGGSLARRPGRRASVSSSRTGEAWGGGWTGVSARMSPSGDGISRGQCPVY